MTGNGPRHTPEGMTMPARKTDRHAARITMRSAIVLSVLVFLGAAAWLIGTDYLASIGTGTAAKSVECNSCTLRHRDMERLREFLKDEKHLNK